MEPKPTPDIEATVGQWSPEQKEHVMRLLMQEGIPRKSEPAEPTVQASSQQDQTKTTHT